MTDLEVNLVFHETVRCRRDFGVWLNARWLVGEAAELGVHRGHFAARFLADWRGSRYWAVDHYQPTDDYPHDRAEDRATARALLGHDPRVRWCEVSTAEFLRDRAPGSLDFVYVDASHRPGEVDQDVTGAWAAVRPGGVLAGHDYDPRTPAVIAAVKRLAVTLDLTVYLTRDTALRWSWFLLKPEP